MGQALRLSEPEAGGLGHAAVILAPEDDGGRTLERVAGDELEDRPGLLGLDLVLVEVSRDLIGKRNLYRYSPHHLYEHVYISSERYAWQCVQGVQRGHGDMDMSTVWKFADGLYLFCFREFRIAVASVWLHDLGYQLMTTGVFLGINGDGEAEHSRAGGHIYPIGSVDYPDVQPV